MADNFIIGMDKLLHKLDDIKFNKAQQKNVIRRTARKGGNVIKDEVRRLIPDTDSYPYGFHIRKSVKVQTSKSRKNPGINVYTKGSAIPFGQGKSRGFWKLQPYQNLYFFGNYKTPGRRTSRGKKRGNVRGATGYNPYTLAKANKGRRALIVMSRELGKEIEKEWRK